MSQSRDQILTKIRANRPTDAIPLPENISFPISFQDVTSKFREVLESIGGTVLQVENEAEIVAHLQTTFPDATHILNVLPEIPFGNVDLADIHDPHELANLDLVLMRGQLGVAESGAIWLSEHEMPHRVAPFITQHLAIVLSKSKIVANLHEAYSQLDVTKTGFGVFLAGPSKTADIEQSLVIGAHGARSLVVFLLP